MSDQSLDLETVIRYNRPTATDGSIQVSTDRTEVTEGSRVLLGFGDDHEVTYAVLTPSEAQTVATALEQAAERAAAADTLEDPTDE
ncbi:hypothetical protein DJ83_13315 [Halorubrum ezzemoulense]|uniref:Uncharacterized protein n=1 Tax=Halorubrum ezzemoulense TaxID=337243 RepID=A0A256ISC8_HALEZ|nr:hypothetical protein [Halorubrum ezzemoulense]OYR59196.1 hypothetical protein DJ83_13315 [Halorubrum ezzemoulense]QAY21094.1 hypothetical protein EO776_14275 [Halorubrum ezzemoulense]SNR70583.1 hypothetical protein SAMN06266787_11252 [Halorubrum ezzemoulense]